MPDPMVAFVRARLGEDAAPVPVPAWHEPHCHDPYVHPGDDACGFCGAAVDPSNVTLVPRSAAVVREVEAKRHVVAAYAESLSTQSGFSETGWEVGRREALELACRAIAAPYFEHPAFRIEWALTCADPAASY